MTYHRTELSPSSSFHDVPVLWGQIEVRLFRFDGETIMNPIMTSAGDSGQRELLRCGVQLIYQAFDLKRQLHELNFQGQELAARMACAEGSEQEKQEIAWQREQVAHLEAELRRRHAELIGFSDRWLAQIEGSGQ